MTEEAKQAGAYPIDPTPEERVATFSIDSTAADGTFVKQANVDWHVLYTPDDKLVDSNALNRTQQRYSLQTVPEMFYGDSRLYLACPQRNFLLSFSPLDCIHLCHFESAQKRLRKSESQTNIEAVSNENVAAAQDDSNNNDDSPAPDDGANLNAIDMIPEPIMAHQAENWQQKETTTNVQFGQISAINKTMDWSFQSAYKGTILPLRQSLENLLPAEFTIPEEFRQKLLDATPE